MISPNKEIVMEEATARRAAEALLGEHKTHTKFKPLDASYGLASMAEAYDIQDQYVALLRAGQGEAVGYKVALTSKAMQAFCGVDDPACGVVLAKRVHPSGATVRRAEYGRIGLEFEIAVRIKSDIPPEAQTPQAIAPHVDGVCAAFEIVDDRAADYGNFDVRSVIADNAWNAGLVLSDFSTHWPDLEGLLGKATSDGAPLGEGYGRDILGHPFNSVAWLNAHLASRGGGLRKGQLVSTGSVIKTVFPIEPANFRFEFAGLSSVEVRVV
jgi:2-keto-4-pentenoate hydratase